MVSSLRVLYTPWLLSCLGGNFPRKLRLNFKCMYRNAIDLMQTKGNVVVRKLLHLQGLGLHVQKV